MESKNGFVQSYETRSKKKVWYFDENELWAKERWWTEEIHERNLCTYNL